MRNPLQPALVSFYEGCGLRRIQIASAEWTTRRPSVRSRARSGDRHHQDEGTDGTIFFCRAESASFADSAVFKSHRRSGQPGDLRSDRVHGRETTHPFHGGHRRHDHRQEHALTEWRCRARLRAPWILGWKNVCCPQSADHKNIDLPQRRSGDVGRNPLHLRTPPYSNRIGGVDKRGPFRPT